jgi:hypothetical protein
MAWPDPQYPVPAPGSISLEDPRNDAWRGLLPPAATIINAGRPRIDIGQITVGGGSMLAKRYGHRRSRDLDFFVPDPQYLGIFSPRLNDNLADFADDYGEESSSLKFIFGEQEVDFVVAAKVLYQAKFDHLTFSDDISIAIERPGEIIAKKLLYRSANFTHRDVFDLAMVAVLEPHELDDAAEAIGRRALSVVQKRLEMMTPSFNERIVAYINPTTEYKGLMNECLPLAKTVVSKLISEPSDSDSQEANITRTM